MGTRCCPAPRDCACRGTFVAVGGPQDVVHDSRRVDRDHLTVSLDDTDPSVTEPGPYAEQAPVGRETPYAVPAPGEHARQTARKAQTQRSSREEFKEGPDSE